ncbi:MAG: class I SAM-dependent methyltransferase [Sphingomonadales bacterium]|nr:class I SAM-dependent methyltransferase [Sphingomonadales bacterium]
MHKCLICNSKINPFISYGQMPIANGFLTKEKFNNEYFFNMQVAHCTNCSMVQLIETPERQLMFNENYAFFSGTSQAMKTHFLDFANDVKNRFLPKNDAFVVEIGSNDGIMLQNFKEWGIRHLGIEPSANVAQVAKNKGINTIVEFFDEKLAEKIVSENGQADAFIAANVMCHLPYFHSIVAGISKLVKKSGIVVFEEPYVGDVVEKTSYDQIYDEHTFLFSVSSINYIFKEHGMEVIDIAHQETHGGSMRYIIGHKGVRNLSNEAIKQIQKEKELALNSAETYLNFKNNCENSKIDLKKLLQELKSKGKRVAGYGATSKSTTILNYSDIGPDLIEYICDNTPIKQGKYSPGKHIPIVPIETFKNSYPDYLVLFAYNHAKEIMDKEKDFTDKGGKWILYVPKIHVI